MSCHHQLKLHQLGLEARVRSKSSPLLGLLASGYQVPVIRLYIGGTVTVTVTVNNYLTGSGTVTVTGKIYLTGYGYGTKILNGGVNC
jgi:hypothetical protein